MRPAAHHVRTRASTRQLAVFTRQFATLTMAGIPLHKALAMLASPSGGEGLDASVPGGLADRLAAGSRLAEAMSHYPGVFPDYYLSLVKVGENTGELVRNLDRLADLLERAARFRSQLLSRLTYPALLLASCLIAVGVLVFGFVPMMAEVFRQWDLPPPATLRLLWEVGGLARRPVGWLILGLVLGNLALAATALRRDPVRAREVRRAVLRWTGTLPLLGGLQLQAARVRALELLASLLEAGIGAEGALLRLAEATDCEELRLRLRMARVDLLEGQDLTSSLRGQQVFAPASLQLIRAGEASGRLGGMIRRACRLEEFAAEVRLEAFLVLLEPLVLTVLGVVVGALTLTSLLPLLSVLGRL